MGVPLHLCGGACICIHPVRQPCRQGASYSSACCAWGSAAGRLNALCTWFAHHVAAALNAVQVLSTLGCVAGKRVLELGAGIGRFTGELARAGTEPRMAHGSCRALMHELVCGAVPLHGDLAAACQGCG